MTKDVLVTVRGRQISDGEEDELEIIHSGLYYEKNNKIYIKYDEESENGQGVISNMIKIGKEGLEITKKGMVGAQMIFRENERINSCYDTPYGRLDIVIYTNEIRYKTEEDLIEVNMSYVIEMNGETLSESDVFIRVEPRGKANIKLT